MLLKVLKQDLKFIYKPLLIFVSIQIVLAILCNLTSYDFNPAAPSIVAILHTFLYSFVTTWMIAMFLNTCMRLWHYMRKNFYGDEAYLTHTLPVKRNTLWASKFLLIVISNLAMLLSVIISFKILSLTESGRSLISNFGVTSGASPTFLFVFIFTIFTQLLFLAFSGILGTVIGHRAKTHQAFLSRLIGIGVYFLGVLIMVGVFLTMSAIDPTVHSLIFGSASEINVFDIVTISFITRILLIASITYSTIIVAMYFIGQKLLKNGINLN